MGKVARPDGVDLSEGEPALRAGEEHADRADVGALVVDDTAHQDQLGHCVGGFQWRGECLLA